MKGAIGIFDSGIGGTSIAAKIHQLLPWEDLIYLADSKNAPYGNKSKEAIVELAHKNTKKLIALGVKLIVVACNTATTNAIKELRKTYPLPFVGIEPAIKPAAIKTHNLKIGILATKGTLASKLFSETTKKYVSEQIKVVQVEGKGIVEAIENNSHTSPEFIHLLKEQLLVFKTENIDCLVLGCTHYPYISKQIQDYLPEVNIIDSGFAVANQTKRILNSNQLENEVKRGSSSTIIYSNATTLEPIKVVTKNNFGSNIKIEFLDF
jgi:glutamate racemase